MMFGRIPLSLEFWPESNKQRSARVEEVEAELSAADYNNCNSNRWTGDKNMRTRLQCETILQACKND